MYKEDRKLMQVKNITVEGEVNGERLIFHVHSLDTTATLRTCLTSSGEHSTFGLVSATFPIKGDENGKVYTIRDLAKVPYMTYSKNRNIRMYGHSNLRNYVTVINIDTGSTACFRSEDDLSLITNEFRLAADEYFEAKKPKPKWHNAVDGEYWKWRITNAEFQLGVVVTRIDGTSRFVDPRSNYKAIEITDPAIIEAVKVDI